MVRTKCFFIIFNFWVLHRPWDFQLENHLPLSSLCYTVSKKYLSEWVTNPGKGSDSRELKSKKITQQSTNRNWLLWCLFSKSVSIYPRSTPAASTCKLTVLRKKISTHSSILLSRTFVMIHLIMWHPVFVLFLLTCFPTKQNHFNLFTPRPSYGKKMCPWNV